MQYDCPRYEAQRYDYASDSRYYGGSGGGAVGGGSCPISPASATQKASGTNYVWAAPKEPVTQYVWAAQSEEECREWSVHKGYPRNVPGLVSPLISTEKDTFSDRVTLALPVLGKMVAVLSGDGALLSTEDRELRDQIAYFYGLENSNDALFHVLQSNLLPLIHAIDIELRAAKEDPSAVFRQKNVVGHDAMYQDGKVYLNTPFWDMTAKYQASTIVHEFSHKVGMKHEKRLTLAAAIIHVEKQRVEVLNTPPWESELRSDKLLNNINDTYFLELLFLGQL